MQQYFIKGYNAKLDLTQTVLKYVYIYRCKKFEFNII